MNALIRSTRLKQYLQEHDGALNFATDAWTSPNQKAFVAITVHFEVQGVPACLILDIVEVAESHSGWNLAAAFARVLAEFGIEHKVCATTLLFRRRTHSLDLERCL